MIVRAHAKINLSLQVGAVRADGFHELQSLFQTVSLADELAAEESDELTLEVKGSAPADNDNLVLRAASALARESGHPPRARLRLVKRIPMGAGLAGGSSDAAATLLALDRLWGVAAAIEDLHRLALELGSDVPFFLLGGTALGLGRGERLFALAEPPPRHVVLALPDLHVATTEAFRSLDQRPRVAALPTDGWPHARLWRWEEGAYSGLTNDFEEPVFERHPRLRELKQVLRQAGSEHALMTGSGAAVFGLFRDDARAREAASEVRALGVEVALAETVDRVTVQRERWTV